MPNTPNDKPSRVNQESPYFRRNINYIIREIARHEQRRFTMEQYADFLGVQRLSLLKYVHGEYEPKINTAITMAAAIKDKLGWELSGQDLLHTDITEKYTVANKVKQIEEARVVIHTANIDDVTAIGKRLKRLRKERGWSLADVSKKTTEWFPNQKEYKVSHTHIMQMERGIVTNLNVHKIKSLATVYQRPVEYVLFGWEEIDGVTVDRGKNLIMIPLSRKLQDKEDFELIAIAKKAKEIIEMI